MCREMMWSISFRFKMEFRSYSKFVADDKEIYNIIVID